MEKQLKPVGESSARVGSRVGNFTRGGRVALGPSGGYTVSKQEGGERDGSTGVGSMVKFSRGKGERRWDRVEVAQ